MNEIAYYIVDVFTSSKYGGNQLAVFIDFEDQVSEKGMLQIARELNFSEITFVKRNHEDRKFDVRIFTPECEVPFAGHPSLGTAYIISKYVLPAPQQQIILNLKHSEIGIDLSCVNNLESCEFIMEQSQPEFLGIYQHQDIARELGISLQALDTEKPIEEISTGLPYIIIPVISLEEMNNLKLKSEKVIEFLTQNGIYKTNSSTGLSTCLFFVTGEVIEKSNNYNARMFCVENGALIEDAATGSANGCFLAYLLKNYSSNVSAIVEQGFQMNRKSYIKLDGHFNAEKYTIRIGGNVVEQSNGVWRI